MSQLPRIFALLGIPLFAVACGAARDPSPSPGPGPDPLPTPAPVPDPTSAPADPRCGSAPPGPGFVCVQDCGPPVARPEDPEPGWQWLSADDAEKRKTYGCPRCLPPTALISTPRGQVPIARLREGELVDSTNAAGERVQVPIVAVLRTPAPGHHVLHVFLSDGREVRASGPHPLADGRTLDSLAVGDPVGAASVLRVVREPFEAAETMDLVIDGETGAYVADGVLLRSTRVLPRAVDPRFRVR